MFGSSMRPWLVVAAGVAVILLAYLLDGILAGAFREAKANHALASYLVLDAAARFLGAAWLLGLGWLLFVGPRQRLAGLVTLVIGSHVALSLVLWEIGGPSIVMLANTRHPIVLPMWMGSGVALLGLAELVWPSTTANA